MLIKCNAKRECESFESVNVSNLKSIPKWKNESTTNLSENNKYNERELYHTVFIPM